MGFASVKKSLEENKQFQNIKNEEIKKFKEDLENYEDNTLLDKIIMVLKNIVNKNKLNIYYDDKKIYEIANNLISNNILCKISESCKIGNEKQILNILSLSLYNIVLFADDSGSMQNGDRIIDLKNIINDISKIITFLDDDGISLKFFNSGDLVHEINTSEKVHQYINNMTFTGRYTPIGTTLNNCILEFMKMCISRNVFDKPALIIIITDGEPNEPDRKHKKLYNVINDAKLYLKNNNLPEKSFVYSFGLVGDDIYGQKFIDSLDNDKNIGDVVDATSSIEIEGKQIKDLTDQLWLYKLLLGTIDSDIDKLDELPAYTR